MRRRTPGTGVDVFIDDKPYWSNGGYSIVEDSTPVDPSDETGGFGQITVPIPDGPDVKRMWGRTLELLDGAKGQTIGVVRGRSGDGHIASVVADSRLAQLSATRRADPFHGTLDAALRYYFGLCGIVDGIVIDAGIGAQQVALPGWNANVFDQIKRMAPAYDFEMSLVSSNVVIRPLRERVAVHYRDSTESWAMDEGQLAQTVQGYWYNNEWKRDLAYPAGGWSEEVTVYTVEAGSTTVIDLEIGASLVTVEQPVCEEFVDRMHGSTSVYSVTGSDDLPVKPEQWAAGGGSLMVEIGEDTKSLTVTIVASAETQYAPYRIAVSAGPSDYYSSLRVVGTGVFTEPESMTLYAAVGVPDLAPTEVGHVVENEFFETRAQLYHALLRTAARYGTPRQTITVTTGGINRVGDSGSAVYPTIGDLIDLHPGATIGDLATQLGPTIGDWNDKLFALVADDFENQAFGNTAGARVLAGDSWYRIRSATASPSSVTYQAERDNTIGDIYHHGETIGEWNARWAGKTIGDVNIEPLQGLPTEGRPF